jgi:hypothetical protein
MNTVIKLQVNGMDPKKGGSFVMNSFLNFSPPGHYYSPIPSMDEIKENEDKIFSCASTVPGVQLNKEKQLKLLDEFSRFYDEIPFSEHKEESTRYYFHNGWFSYGDAIALYSMIRHLSPKRIIEVGSGFSSAVMLDTNDLFFNNSIDCTFIEPNPERFKSMMGENNKLFIQKVQDVDIENFRALQENDILFIDSSHVSKIGSDVNFIFSEVLPKLNKGVYIHFHDIFFPFEYPKEWVYKGVAWNEAYLLKAFLQFNCSFDIVLWNHYLSKFHSHEISLKLPLWLKSLCGSIWLVKSK